MLKLTNVIVFLYEGFDCISFAYSYTWIKYAVQNIVISIIISIIS